jgi:hypothetical protein
MIARKNILEPAVCEPHPVSIIMKEISLQLVKNNCT